MAAARKRAKKNRAVRTAGKLLLILVLLGLCALAFWTIIKDRGSEEAFAAGSSSTVPVYAQASDGSMHEVARLIRGSEVTVLHRTVEADSVTYRRVRTELPAELPAEEAVPDEEDAAAEGQEETAEETEEPDLNMDVLYMAEDSLVATPEECVQETEIWVRTPATIYVEATGPAIASFAAKGTMLEVTGYDILLEDGNVNKYRVAYTDPDGTEGEGYVFSKYMTDDEEYANSVYNEYGETDKAAKDTFRYDLYGGDPAHLDYFPYERPVIEGNEFCSYARAMYINTQAAVHPDNYVKLIGETDCNAVVIDIKDGMLAYQSPVAEELSPTSYKHAYATVENYKAGIDAYRDTGVYLIGRIVVFNDPEYAADHPEDCIKYGSSKSWPSAYARGVWEYNVRLAREAVELFGFNEIQFDYVRFPEATYEMSKSGNADFRNKYGEEKGQAVQNFCFYAADQIHDAGAYFSVDVFGESVYGYMTAYGQYWPAISNIVDAISAMPYTDHTGGEGAWTRPYNTMKTWGKKAAKMQKRLQDPAVPRTWITGYNTPYWAPTENYNEEKLMDQIRGLEDAGLDGGFIPWNVLSDLDKYRQYKAIWNE